MSSTTSKKTIGVLTSGGDAPGMNAAVRAVVRTAISRGVDVYAIYEGYQGMVDGGERIRKMSWNSVGGILQQGGTTIGTARCAEFRTREGRRKAARNLLQLGIDSLVVIGGDGSLTGADIFRREWPELLRELVEQRAVSPGVTQRHPYLTLVGLVGSIDNDMFGTDMTIGADTALHRITEAIDAIASTAASHQRAFVVEVMGRHCGYLALMASLAGSANWVFIPESPPEADDWESEMCATLRAGRQMGRRHSMVIVAEGAQDKHGQPITSAYVRQVIEERLGEDTRITVLGHMQRGGAPSAFDRNLGTLVGSAAVDEILSAPPNAESKLIGIRENSVIHSPLAPAVEETQRMAEVIAARDYEQAMALRGGSFQESYSILKTLLRAAPHAKGAGQPSLRVGLIHCGGPAAGMNTAVRAAVRLGLDQGLTMLAIHNGFEGLLDGEISEMDWMSVSSWASHGGAELGTSRLTLEENSFLEVARQLEAHNIQALLMIGGWVGYESAYTMHMQRQAFREFNIPIVCLPASINNNLPGSEYSIGCDTALNNIVENVDKIKQSAVASRRCFVVEVMGRYCGYLALTSALATGAERVYLHEEGISLADLQRDLANLVEGFNQGKRLGLIIRNERADSFYSTEFISALFEKEGGDLFDVRQTILGHVQQGGDPTPFDRIQATRMAARCIDFLREHAHDDPPPVSCIGLLQGRVRFTGLEDFPTLVDEKLQRPRQQWWLRLRPIMDAMAIPQGAR
ncbi:MAG: 6-phosphofructokinase [Chloroflexota bacterium]|nr:MAG: 6-phosphofructokinase [Chloroflexota bacterium]